MGEHQETAEEFMARLRKNPEFRKREQQKLEKLRQAELESERKYAPVLQMLAEAGFEAPSIYKVANLHAPLPRAAIEILLSSIPDFDGDDKRKEFIVRPLAAAAERFDGSVLAESYDRATHEGLKFAIINTIACAMPYRISQWLRKARRDPWFEMHLRAIGEEVHGKDFARYLEESES